MSPESSRHRIPLPQPKINVPPQPEADLAEEMLSAPSSWMLPARVAGPVAARAPRREAIRWDFRFVVSLVLLTVCLNVALAVLLRRGDADGEVFLAGGGAVADARGLSSLSPAAGDTHDGGTTTYISGAGQGSLLQQIERLPQPGIVALPPASVAPTPDTGE